MRLVCRGSNKQIHGVKFLITSLCLVILSGPLSAAIELGPQLAQQRIGAWLEVHKTIADEKKDFSSNQLILNKLLDVYRIELGLLEQEVLIAGETLIESDAELEAIKISSAKLRQARDQLQDKVDDQASRLLEIMHRFPNPLLKELSKEQLSLSDPATKLRAKVLAMVTVVKSTMKFNQVITYSEEIQFVDGIERQLQVLYLGLGQGYYVSGTTAGLVDADSTGWKFIRKDQYLKVISHAIGVYQKTTRPELVKLPIQLAK